jgi:hypothetical protein
VTGIAALLSALATLAGALRRPVPPPLPQPLSTHGQEIRVSFSIILQNEVVTALVAMMMIILLVLVISEVSNRVAILCREAIDIEAG